MTLDFSGDMGNHKTCCTTASVPSSLFVAPKKCWEENCRESGFLGTIAMMILRDVTRNFFLKKNRAESVGKEDLRPCHASCLHRLSINANVSAPAAIYCPLPNYYIFSLVSRSCELCKKAKVKEIVCDFSELAQSYVWNAHFWNIFLICTKKLITIW